MSTRTWVVRRPLSNPQMSANVDLRIDFISGELRNAALELRASKGLFLCDTLYAIRMQDCLSKDAGGRKRKASGKKVRSRQPNMRAERGEEGGLDEAVAFIAEYCRRTGQAGGTASARSVRRHLLGMAQLEAEERLRTRSRHKLS